ncbi:hypothetical protein FQR65_LT14256 [Abscondita terminalis]|nr:hypothetical protein FQR65_LT14256 [Abscondita terminalis]
MMSDESENDGAYIENSYENDIYYKKYKLLLERCELIQKHNQQLVYRLQQVKKVTNNRYEAVKSLKQRLKDLYNEDWTVIPKEELEEEVESAKNSNFKVLIKCKEERDEKEKTKGKKAPKRKAGKSERDPKAPKRPSNPFFQFCQEQRQILMEQLNAELKPGEAELSKQELTRQLAIKWKTLSQPDKKIYVDMYEKSKEKYAAELSEYNMKNAKVTVVVLFDVLPKFQFCQEQRQILMEQLNAELKPGEAELSKQELTRQLAIKWKTLSQPDKKIYVDMYEKSKRDPKAPKRPSNPFFQFCQEQRQILMEQLNAELKPGEAELSKQELTRQLAIKWKTLSQPDKKIYVDMYEKSKEKYAAELSEYNMKK